MKTIEIIKFTGETKLIEITGKDEAGAEIVQIIEVPEMVVVESYDCTDEEAANLLHRAKLQSDIYTLSPDDAFKYSARMKEEASEKA